MVYKQFISIFQSIAQRAMPQEKDLLAKRVKSGAPLHESVGEVLIPILRLCMHYVGLPSFLLGAFLF